MRRLIFMALLGVLCISFGSVAWAQRLDGTLRVTITDKSQASIEDAKVTVENEATGVSAATTTSSAGTYVFPNLLVGTYAVTVEKDGFKKAVQKGVAVSSNQVAEAKVVVELGSVSAVVEVEANADLVKTQSSELGATFSGLAVHDVPINTLGGDVKEFSVYAPGTTTLASASTRHVAPDRARKNNAPASHPPDPLKSFALPVGAFTATSTRSMASAVRPAGNAFAQAPAAVPRGKV